MPDDDRRTMDKQVLASKLLGEDNPQVPPVVTGEDVKAQQRGGGAPLDVSSTAVAAATATTTKGGDAIPTPSVEQPKTPTAVATAAAEAGRGGSDSQRKGQGAAATPVASMKSPEDERGAVAGEGKEGAQGVRIVAVDLQEMAPIEGVKQLQVSYCCGGCDWHAFVGVTAIFIVCFLLPLLILLFLLSYIHPISQNPWSQA